MNDDLIYEDFEYVPKNKLFNLFSNILYYCIAYPILYILTKIIYDLKIEGKENLKNIHSGAISISNHVLVLDCAMIGLALGFKRVYYTTQEESFKIPFVKRLIRFLRAIPIPKQNKYKPLFIEALDDILCSGNIVHFYPEASLIPYCHDIRDFKTGAFRFAIKNDVPIIPMIFTFRNPTGIRKLFKKKKDVTLTILKPIKYDDYSTNNRQDINNFRDNVYTKMTTLVDMF